MRRQRPHSGMLMSVGIVLLIGAVHWRPEVEADNGFRPTISVEDLRESTVIGHIGVPLGKVVKVTGRVIEDSSQMKGRDEKRLVLIETVDGQRLTTAEKFWDEDVGVGFQDGQATRKLIAQPGALLQLAVYETGGFEGWPHGDVYRPVPQSRSFHFRTRLVIVHDFQNPPETRPVPSPFPKKS